MSDIGPDICLSDRFFSVYAYTYKVAEHQLSIEIK